MVICLERGANCLRMVQLMPLHLLPHINPDWFYFSGTGSPRLSWRRGHQTGVVAGAVIVVVVAVFVVVISCSSCGRSSSSGSYSLWTAVMLCF